MYKDHYPHISDEEYGDYYECASRTNLAERPADLNKKSMKFIMSKVTSGSQWIDAGCGRGWLAKQLAQQGCIVTGVDIVKPANFSNEDGYKFVNGSIDNLPFEDNSFDNVVCAHVLEHVRNFEAAINELLRVTKKQLIVVVPKQREYRYTADLHVRFFPYIYNVQMSFPKNAIIERVGSDRGIIIEEKAK